MCYFPRGFHGERKQTFEQGMNNLREDDSPFEVCPIILTCCKEENVGRAKNDGRDVELNLSGGRRRCGK